MMVVVEDYRDVDRQSNSCSSTFVTVVSFYHHQRTVQESYLCSHPTIYQHVLPWVFQTLLLTTLRSWSLLVSTSSLQPRNPLSWGNPSPPRPVHYILFDCPIRWTPNLSWRIWRASSSTTLLAVSCESPTPCLAFVQLLMWRTQYEWGPSPPRT